MEHVYEKIINLDNESQTTSSSNNEKPGEQEKEEDIAVLAEEKIELLCQDQVLDPNMDLRTVKHFIWKSGGDLTLHYRQKSTWRAGQHSWVFIYWPSSMAPRVVLGSPEPQWEQDF